MSSFCTDADADADGIFFATDAYRCTDAIGPSAPSASELGVDSFLIKDYGEAEG